MRTDMFVLHCAAILVLAVTNIIAANHVEFDAVNNVKLDTPQATDGSCQCETGLCSCCQTVTARGVSKQICIKVTYQKTATEFSFSVSVDGHQMYKATVQASNPPQKCTTFTIKGYTVKACINFSNFKIEGGELSGCMNLVASAMGRSKTVDFGCFKTGSNTKEDDEFGRFLLNIVTDTEYDSFRDFFFSLMKKNNN